MRRAIKTVGYRPDAEAGRLTQYLCSREGLAADELLVGHGSSHLLALLIRSLRPRSVLVPSPFPHLYSELFQKHGVTVHPFPLDEVSGFQVEAKTFKALWKDAEAALVFNPHDPTGVSLPREAVMDLIETSGREGRLLIIHEGLTEFVDESSYAQRVVESRHAVILRTFSQFHALAGLRLGYAIAHPALLDQLRGHTDPWPANSVALAAALASLKDKGYARRTFEFLAAEKSYVRKALEGSTGTRLYETPWGFVMKLQPNRGNAKQLFLDKGILIEIYEDAQGNEYLALPLRSRADNASFVRTVRRMLREQKAT